MNIFSLGGNSLSKNLTTVNKDIGLYDFDTFPDLLGLVFSFRTLFFSFECIFQSVIGIEFFVPSVISFGVTSLSIFYKCS